MKNRIAALRAPLLALLLSASASLVGAYDSLPSPAKILGFGRNMCTLASGASQRSLVLGGDDSVRLHELETGRVLKAVSGGPWKFFRMDFSPDGGRFAVGFTLKFDGFSGGMTALALFDARQGDSLAVFVDLESPGRTFYFTPDSRSILLGLEDGRLLLLDSALKARDSTRLPAPVALYGGYDYTTLHQVKFADDGTRVLIHTADSGASLLALPGLALLKRHEAKAWGNCYQFELSPDGKAMLAYRGAPIYKHAYQDALTGDTLLDLARYRPTYSTAESRNGVGFSPDARRAFTSFDSGFKVWNLESGEVSATLIKDRIRDDDFIFSTFSLDGEFLIAQTHGKFTVWNLATQAKWSRDYGRILGPTFKDGSGTERFIAVDRLSFSNGEDDTLLSVRISDGEAGKMGLTGYHDIISAAFTVDGSRVYATAAPARLAWDPGSGRVQSLPERPYYFLKPESRAFWVIDGDLSYITTDVEKDARIPIPGKYFQTSPNMVSHDLSTALLFGGGDTLWVERVATGDKLCTLAVNRDTQAELERPEISFHGDYVVASSPLDTLKILSTRTCRVISSRRVSSVEKFVFSPAQDLFLRLGTLSESCLGRLSDSLWQDRDYQYCVPAGRSGNGGAISPDGSKFIVGNRIYETRKGRLLLKLNLAEAGIRHADFSPDGKKVVVSTYPGPLTVWDLTGPTVRLGEAPPRPSTYQVRPRIALSPAGRRLRWTLSAPYSVPGPVALELIDLSGRKVSYLPVPGAAAKEGYGELGLPGTLPSGCYIYRFLGLHAAVLGSRGRILLP